MRRGFAGKSCARAGRPAIAAPAAAMAARPWRRLMRCVFTMSVSFLLIRTNAFPAFASCRRRTGFAGLPAASPATGGDATRSERQQGCARSRSAPEQGLLRQYADLFRDRRPARHLAAQE